MALAFICLVHHHRRCSLQTPGTIGFQEVHGHGNQVSRQPVQCSDDLQLSPAVPDDLNGHTGEKSFHCDCVMNRQILSSDIRLSDSWLLALPAVYGA